MKNWFTFEGAIQDFRKILVSNLIFIHYWSIIGQLLANNWPIMDFLKTFTYFETLNCLRIQTTSPHTLGSIPFIYMCRIIEEKKFGLILEGVICDFVKVLVWKSVFIHYWPIIGQLLTNNGFFQNVHIFGTLHCLGIQSASPHTLESIHVI